MISFDTEVGRFSFRSVAVIIYKDQVLIHRDLGDDFWCLPGGRVELFETASKAVKREMFEELGLESDVVRQLWHVENFFILETRRYHELADFFLMSFCNQPTIKSEIDFKGIETSVNLLFRWVPLKNLANYNLKPKFLIEKLADLPTSIEHLSIDEINTL